MSGIDIEKFNEIPQLKKCLNAARLTTVHKSNEDWVKYIWDNAMEYAEEQAAKRNTNAPTIQRDGWVSVADGLPDETYVDVLIYPYLGDDNCVITAHLDADRTWRYYEPSLRFANLPCSPTYWQQLPASPTDTE